MLSRVSSRVPLLRFTSSRVPSIIPLLPHRSVTATFSSSAHGVVPSFSLQKDDKLAVYARVTEQQEKGKYVHEGVIRDGKHKITLDERGLHGGLDLGPSPYDLLVTALGACTSMTLRMYAQRKTQFLAVPRLSVEVVHSKKNSTDVAECPPDVKGQVDVFEVTISVVPTPTDAPLTPEAKSQLLEIADKCPVHKTLAGNPKTFVRTKWA